MSVPPSTKQEKKEGREMKRDTVKPLSGRPEVDNFVVVWEIQNVLTQGFPIRGPVAPRALNIL